MTNKLESPMVPSKDTEFKIALILVTQQLLEETQQIPEAKTESEACQPRHNRAPQQQINPNLRRLFHSKLPPRPTQYRTDPAEHPHPLQQAPDTEINTQLSVNNTLFQLKDKE